jgi:hypothetical protein
LENQKPEANKNTVWQPVFEFFRGLHKIYAVLSLRRVNWTIDVVRRSVRSKLSPEPKKLVIANPIVVSSNERVTAAAIHHPWLPKSSMRRVDDDRIAGV